MGLDAAKVYCDAFGAGLTPSKRLLVSEWADERRYLSSKASAEPGRWRTSRTPYLKEIMDVLSVSDRTQEVVFMKGAQIGATEAINNFVGYIIDHAPGPAMMVMATLPLVKTNVNTRINPMIEATSVLREKILPARSRDSGNTQYSKDFPGGVIVFSGANSPSSLRSMPVKYLALDEVDGYPGDVGGEGDPIALARVRTSTFRRKKIILSSTPTIDQESRIQFAFENSDQRFYEVPCPECDEFQVITWDKIHYDDAEPELAHMVCEHCACIIEEHKKEWMLPRGKWVKKNPKSRVAGFHLSSLYSPLGWKSWGEIAQQWVDINNKSGQEKTELRKVFVNTVLGEVWRDHGEVPDHKRLYLAHRRPYDIGTCPEGVVFLTAGVDVQENRIEVEVVGWGQGLRQWSIDYIVLDGQTNEDEVWDKLTGVLNRQFPHENGSEIPITVMAVDSGYRTQNVYNWCRKYKATGRVMAVKGSDTQNAMVGRPRDVDVNLRGEKTPRGAKLWMVGSSVIKREIYGNLRQEIPLDEKEELPNGACVFPEYDEDYFLMLTAEQLEYKMNNGFSRPVWKKIRERNEALDCRVYARAAASAYGIDRFTEKKWSQLKSAIGGAVKKKKTKPQTQNKVGTMF